MELCGEEEELLRRLQRLARRDGQFIRVPVGLGLRWAGWCGVRLGRVGLGCGWGWDGVDGMLR